MKYQHIFTLASHGLVRDHTQTSPCPPVFPICKFINIEVLLFMHEQFSSVNGIDYYSLTNPNLKSFCLSLYIRAGSLFEDSSDNGISHLFEHIVFRNLKRKYRSFYELLAMHGIDLSGCTYKEFIRFTINGPYDEFAFAVEILCGLFDEIQLSSEEFNKEKKRIKAEIREENERSTLDYFFNRIIWKNSEAEKTVLGYCRVIDGISVKRINLFRRKVLSRGNCFVYVTGNVSPENLEVLSRKISKLDICQENTGFTNTVTVNEDFFHRSGTVQVKNGYWHYIKVGFDIDCSKYPGGVYDCFMRFCSREIRLWYITICLKITRFSIRSIAHLSNMTI